MRRKEDYSLPALIPQPEQREEKPRKGLTRPGEKRYTFPSFCFRQTGNGMNLQKIGVIFIFLLMALGGIGGVMLTGYTILIRS